MPDEFDDESEGGGGIAGPSGRIGSPLAGVSDRVDRLEHITDRTDDRVLRLEKRVDTLTTQLRQLTDLVNRLRQRPAGGRPD